MNKFVCFALMSMIALNGCESEYNNDTIFLRACSYNLGDFTGTGFDTPSEEGKLAYHQVFYKIGADIIGTQEDVEFYGETNQGGVGYASVRTEILPMFKHYYRTGTGKYNFKGFASNFKIRNSKKVNYTGDYEFTHPWFLVGELTLKRKTILVASFHFDWNDKKNRRTQIEQIIEYCKKYPYVILMGDTNPENYENGLRIDQTLFYQEEWGEFSDAGYEMANNGKFGIFATVGSSPIDNIFVKGGCIKNVFTIKESWMNDHNPIVADIVLLPE